MQVETHHQRQTQRHSRRSRLRSRVAVQMAETAARLVDMAGSIAARDPQAALTLTRDANRLIVDAQRLNEEQSPLEPTRA